MYCVGSWLALRHALEAVKLLKIIYFFAGDRALFVGTILQQCHCTGYAITFRVKLSVDVCNLLNIQCIA
jgi:hypothetical protein